MRKIKFRGKGLKSNKWIFGCLVGHHQAYYDGTSNRVCITSGILTTEEVIPETVAQYTGLKDINGNEIYEGDILEYTFKDGVKSKEKYLVLFDEDSLSFRGIVMPSITLFEGLKM